MAIAPLADIFSRAQEQEMLQLQTTVRQLRDEQRKCVTPLLLRSSSLLPAHFSTVCSCAATAIIALVVFTLLLLLLLLLCGLSTFCQGSTIASVCEFVKRKY
jgi:hypothetical protein